MNETSDRGGLGLDSGAQEGEMDRRTIEDYKAQIIDGTIEVPTTPAG